MPGLAQRNDHLSNGTSFYYSLSAYNGPVPSSGFWSKHRDDVSYNQLQKFCSELSSQAWQDLLRIDKQTLFEQARKNMYCSRCNGLLLDGFLQIVIYGKSLQQEGGDGQVHCDRLGNTKKLINGESSESSVCQDDFQDPSVHPWGGLTTTRDGALTLLDCYLYSKSLKGLQNVFDSARARERERELLYPDACGGVGRGWISPAMASYGRGHGPRETCALHTARLSCDTLVDFWSALGEETQKSLLRMKEEDFIERLMYRFSSKRFCRDCRRNVIHEFKELKRMRRETRCTSWFCVADTAFQYEVSNDMIYADWHQTFIDSVGTYHHFEWAVGTGEGKSDILDYENVGMNGSVQANGLDLGGLNACYITLRAWKLDGRYSEHSVKAHALKGQHCVHCRLIVGDGHVTITCGESIRRFFEHAEEAEEEEDDDSMDKDGNDLDGECSRPQKHAKSPELAREFLLDAATIIFKEQVEKAFREGTARQNAHSIFVCLALKLLEERVYVACKEIITLEKQMKLLEEEEKEKREEEERRERRRTKEREKKLRRKERLRGKEKEKKCVESIQISILTDIPEEVSSLHFKEASVMVDAITSRPASPDAWDLFCSVDHNDLDSQSSIYDSLENGNDLFTTEVSEVSCQKIKNEREFQLDSSRKSPDRHRDLANEAMLLRSDSRYYDDISDCCSREINGLNRQSRTNTVKFSTRNGGPRFDQKLQLSNNRNDLHSRGCHPQSDCQTKFVPHVPVTKSVNKPESVSKPFNRGNKLSQTDHTRESCGKPRTKLSNYGNLSRDLIHIKKVWEPVEPQKRYPRSHSYTDVTLRQHVFKVEGIEVVRPTSHLCSTEVSQKPLCESRSSSHGREQMFENEFNTEARAIDLSNEGADEEVDSHLTNNSNFDKTCDFSPSMSSSSDNSASCLGEGDSNTDSPNLQILESFSVSDSEDGSHELEGRNASVSVQEVDAPKANGQEAASKLPSWNSVTETSSHDMQNGKIAAHLGSLYQSAIPQIPNPNIHFPNFHSPSTMGYYHHHQSPISWSTALTGGLMPYPNPNHYLFTTPFSYGLAGDPPLCMQYSPVQHLAPPLINPSHIPVYVPFLRANDYDIPAESNFSNGIGVRDPSVESIREKAVATGPQPTADKKNGKSGNLHAGNQGFSLFQFGGPVALSTHKSNPKSFNEGDVSSDFAADHVEGSSDCGCGKKETTIEEYNLFAASKGIRFSIF
ncbi:hypothetical protein Nepgr_031186 [Nepenthes gracilis]|uniref:Stress response protein NST1 n=1 Tax=Nepenthes gracilis TaxID=150966 RepID=A0AAD3TG20_NEPGR|nr:hypothetical protein Nepgr_031186 [Nepenthes gracilis]